MESAAAMDEVEVAGGISSTVARKAQGELSKKWLQNAAVKYIWKQLGKWQAKSLKKSGDLLEMVKKLQREGSLEPQIEDLINRINELQQAKKKASEELREALMLWETLHRELDSLNGEKVHLEEVLSKKQETLRILQLHCQEKQREIERGSRPHQDLKVCDEELPASAGHLIPAWSDLRLAVKEELEALMGQHKDLWEFHVLEQRLVREIAALECSKAQLLSEEMLVLAKLEEVGQRLRLQPEAVGVPLERDRPLLSSLEATDIRQKSELEKLEGQVYTQAQSAPEEKAGKGDASSSFPGSTSKEAI